MQSLKRLAHLILSISQGKASFAPVVSAYWRRLRFKLVQILYSQRLPDNLPASLTFHGYYPRTQVPSIETQLELLIEEFARAVKGIYPNSQKANLLLENSLSCASPSERMNFSKRAVEADPSHPDTYFSLATLCHAQTGRMEGPYAEQTVKGLQAMDRWRERLQESEFAINGRILNHKWTENIGHIGCLDLFIKAQKLRLLPEDHYSIVTTFSSIANSSFLGLFDAHIPIIKYNPGLYWLLHNRYFSSCSERLEVWTLKNGYTTIDNAAELVQNLWREQAREPLIQIRPEEKEQGIKVLKKMGVPEDRWFVTLHIREEASSFSRNSSLSNYILAIRAITERGGYVIRTGHAGMQALPNEIPGCIDYANSDQKSEQMDVFLWSECRFFLGTTSGPLHAVFALSTPTIWSNAVSLGRTSGGYYNTIQVPKLWYSQSQERYLSFSETFSNKDTYGEAQRLEPDLVLKENTEVELAEATIEMLELTEEPRSHRGYDIVKDPDNPLQLRLDSIRAKHGVAGRLPLARSFLRRHAELLQ